MHCRIGEGKADDADEDEGEPPGGAAADVGEGLRGGDEGVDEAGGLGERLSFRNGYGLLHEQSPQRFLARLEVSRKCTASECRGAPLPPIFCAKSSKDWG